MLATLNKIKELQQRKSLRNNDFQFNSKSKEREREKLASSS